MNSTKTVLERVYSAFTNLERDYKKSNKTRSQFIIDKFGGDIQVGASVILHSIYSESQLSGDDIQKFTEVSTIFNNIIAAKDKLDSLRSFDFSEDNAEKDRYISIVEDTGKHIGNTYQLAQQELFKQFGVLHYIATPDYACETTPPECRFFRKYSNASDLVLSSLIGSNTTISDDAVMEISANMCLSMTTLARVGRVYK